MLFSYVVYIFKQSDVTKVKVADLCKYHYIYIVAYKNMKKKEFIYTALAVLSFDWKNQAIS